ncbi:hypothetical protein BpHYR1_034224 [Brachionus plicatilis]|uniref:Uncharacterized protein n=1 Tax=Brachionus plicatilis TaxID=10195 RepID=A0A3M7R248_BRAPC|nr:hypothetical protein BpHYR1_034224 [Brachionus plicatilis]
MQNFSLPKFLVSYLRQFRPWADRVLTKALSRPYVWMPDLMHVMSTFSFLFKIMKLDARPRWIMFGDDVSNLRLVCVEASGTCYSGDLITFM